MRAPVRFRLLLALVLLAPACGQSGSETTAATPAAPDWVYLPPDQVADGWETASLESVGMDPAPLARLMNDLHARPGHLVHGIVLVRHGRMVFEEYFPGRTHPTFGEQPVVFNREQEHCLSSVTKSFTTTLLGLAIDHGFIADAGRNVFELFPELQDLAVGGKRDITLAHLATMTSGLEWDESSRSLRDPLNDLIAWMNLTRTTSQDPVRAVLERPLVATPGTHFNYSGGSTNVLGQAIQRATGQRMDDFARDVLFGPLEIESVWWWLLREDFVYASGDITLRPRDMARFGQMYLNGGTWSGRRVLSPEWIEASSRAYRPLPESDYGAYGIAGYSHGWWVKSEEYGDGAYEAWGWGGQKILVLPDLDMVVVFTGGSYWQSPLLSPHRMMTDYILPAVR